MPESFSVGALLVPPSRTENAIDRLVEEAERAGVAGLGSVWLGQLLTADALTALAIVGRSVPGIALGTAVVPTYPRHPLVLASQALTVQAAIGNRLTLGIGLSHRFMIEGTFGYSYERPVRHLGEYLSVLLPALAGEDVAFRGETLQGTTMTPVIVDGAAPPEVLVAALGPAMLRLAGERAAGTVTWMVGSRTLADHIVPTISAAASFAGRPDPRVVVGLPVCVTADADAARERVARAFAFYGDVPSYRAMFEREGVAGAAEVALIGDEAEVVAAISRLREAGATEFAAMPIGSPDERHHTTDVLGAL